VEIGTLFAQIAWSRPVQPTNKLAWTLPSSEQALAFAKSGIEMLEQDRSILITDDDSGFRETLSGIFEPLGFRTLLAADGVEALDIVRSERVHLLLLDMHMPRLTGLETLKQLRAWDISTPCIMLSAELDDAIRDAARRAKAFDVLGKPVSRQDITDVVARAFREAYDWE